MIRKLFWTTFAPLAALCILVLPATEAGVARAQQPQPNWFPGLYTIAAGPDNLQSNLPAAVYPYYKAWVTDRPCPTSGTCPGYMVSNGTAWVSDQGLTGPAGASGAAGQAATLNLGTVSTGAAGSNVIITNSGTSSAATFNFTIPRGDQGIQGVAGNAGSAATVSVGTVTTGSPGSSVSVTNSGSSSAAVLNFTIPRGDVGATGSAGSNGSNGTSATIAVGTVTTGAAGSSATVTNVGTSGAAVLDFSIPRGNTGLTGGVGPQGPAGADGILSIQRARLTTAANGTVTWTFPTAFGVGVVPRVWAQVVATSGTTDVVNVQTDGAPTNTAVNLRVTRTQQSVVALLGLTILSVPATIGAQQVDVFAVAP